MVFVEGVRFGDEGLHPDSRYADHVAQGITTYLPSLGFTRLITLPL